MFSRQTSPSAKSYLYSSSRLDFGTRDAALGEITNALGSGFEKPVHPVTEEHAQEEGHRSQQQVAQIIRPALSPKPQDIQQGKEWRMCQVQREGNLRNENGERTIDGGFCAAAVIAAQSNGMVLIVSM